MTDWLAPLEQGMPSRGRRELAAVVLAVIRVLLMDPGRHRRGGLSRSRVLDFVSTLEKARLVCSSVERRPLMSSWLAI
jgi:hypothetical protein